MPPCEVVISVRNHSECPLIGLNAVLQAEHAVDEGGLYHLDAKLDEGAKQIFDLLPGESKVIATYTYSSEGGESATAQESILSIALLVDYAPVETPAQA